MASQAAPPRRVHEQLCNVHWLQKRTSKNNCGMWEILRVCAVYRYFVDKGILRTRELSLDSRYASEKEGTSFLIKLKELAILYVKSGEFIIFPTLISCMQRARANESLNECRRNSQVTSTPCHFSISSALDCDFRLHYVLEENVVFLRSSTLYTCTALACLVVRHRMWYIRKRDM